MASSFTSFRCVLVFDCGDPGGGDKPIEIANLPIPKGATRDRSPCTCGWTHPVPDSLPGRAADEARGLRNGAVNCEFLLVEGFVGY